MYKARLPQQLPNHPQRELAALHREELSTSHLNKMLDDYCVNANSAIPIS